MAYGHGLKARQQETSISTPLTAESGLPFIVGTAPVHTIGGKVNDPILAYSYAEAVSAAGYSDDWAKYTICELIYSQFMLYKCAPIVFVNVLDPEKHKKAVQPQDYEITENQVLLPFEAIAGSVTVKIGDGEALKASDDYEVFYDSANLVLEVIDGGGIPTGTEKLNIGFNAVDPSKVSDADIIGGFNVTTKQSTGFELLDMVFPKYGIVPDLVLCPGWSHKSEVAAIMGVKAANINSLFEGKALLDADCSEVRHYTDVPAWKKKQNIFQKTQLLCWPMCGLGEREFHKSVQAAGLMATVDTDNGGCPAESPSNKNLQIDRTILADGTEVLLNPDQANYLNSQGIVTAMNFIGGFVLWGDETACFPANRDPKDYFINVSRMFAWVANSVILTYWKKCDKNLNRRLIDSIVDSINIWLNGLKNEEKILGGRVEFREDENSLVSLMDGKAVFHIYLTPCSPAREIEFVLEYDVGYLSELFAA